MHLRALDWMRYSWHCCPFHGSMMKLISQREISFKHSSPATKSVYSNRAVAEKEVT